MISKDLHAAQDISYFCVKTLILNTLNIKCTTAFQKEKPNKKLNPQLTEMARSQHLPSK